MKKRVVTFGEVMMRLTAEGQQRFSQAHRYTSFFGGSEANVSVSLSHFGLATEHVTRFPDNNLGRAALSMLKGHGVHVDHVQLGGERLGLYFLENGAMMRSPQIIYDRFHSAFSEIKPGSIDWDEVFADASWFHWTGITPAISAGAAAVCLEALKSAKKRGLTISGDINYRRNLWQYGKRALDVMPEMIGYCHKIVGAAEDFKNCLGIESATFEIGCEAVVKKIPTIEHIATTQRETISASHHNLSGQMWSKAELAQSRVYQLTHIVDRIGGGDAFMAGLIYSWLNEKPDKEAIEFATAASALKHSIEGDVNMVSVSEVVQVMKGDNPGKLSR